MSDVKTYPSISCYTFAEAVSLPSCGRTVAAPWIFLFLSQHSLARSWRYQTAKTAAQLPVLPRLVPEAHCWNQSSWLHWDFYLAARRSGAPSWGDRQYLCRPQSIRRGTDICLQGTFSHILTHPQSLPRSLTPFCRQSNMMKSQRRRAESLSNKSLSREHSRALFWENFITSTLWVSSLMGRMRETGREMQIKCRSVKKNLCFNSFDLQWFWRFNFFGKSSKVVSNWSTKIGVTYFTRGPGKARSSTCSVVSCSIVYKCKHSWS